ncbi:MAG: infB, partial [Solirubrobacterales bacterium]|nr:infB [Solirubrobacterales bacterium]
MTKKRVHEIAKDQGMSSKDVLTKLQAAGLDATAASSAVDEAAALKALGYGGLLEGGVGGGGDGARHRRRPHGLGRPGPARRAPAG